MFPLTLLLVLLCAFPLPFAFGEAPRAARASFEDESARPDVTAASLAREIHAAVNAARTERGLPPLAWDEELAAIAQAHSEAMAEQGFFGHVDPGGRDPTERAREAGYRCRKEHEGFITEGVAENLYQSNLYDGVHTRTENGEVTQRLYDWNTEADIAEATVQGWLESEGHRRNLLQPRFDAEGIGIAIGEDDRVYITQNFC